MQEHRIEGDDKLTPNANLKMMEEALQNELNDAVTLHKPGSVIATKQDTFHEVQRDGGLKSITPQQARFRKLFPRSGKR